jgi:ketosteroid isomerase-like protein
MRVNYRRGVAVTKKLVLAVLLVFCQRAACSAQNSKAEQQIRKLDDQRIAAILQQDIPALDRLMSDDFTYTHQGGVTESKADFLAAMKSGTGAFKSLQLSGVTLRVFADVAVITGRCDLTAIREGRNLAIPMHFTEIYTRTKGRWHWLLWQSTRLPNQSAPKP